MFGRLFKSVALTVSFVLVFQPIATSAALAAEESSITSLNDQSGQTLQSAQIETTVTIPNEPAPTPVASATLPFADQPLNLPYTSGAYDKDVNPIAALEPPSEEDEKTPIKSLETTEVISRRTASSKTYRNNDGTYTLKSFTDPIHYQDGDKKWQDIDNSLITSNDPGFRYENKENEFEVRFGAAAPGLNAVEIEKGGGKLSLGFNDLVSGELYALPDMAEINWPQNSGRAVKTGSRELRYKNVYDGTDIKYTSLSNKVKEEIVLNDFSGKNRFLFSLDTGGLYWKKQPGGSIVFYETKTDKKAFMIPAPFMYDSALSSNGQARPNISGAVSMDITVRPSGTYLEVTADRNWLSSAERVYPVVIDPTIYVYSNGANSDDTLISNGYPDTNLNGMDWLASGDSGTDIRYSLLGFDLSDIIVNRGKTEVSSAVLNIYSTGQADNTKPVWVNKITGGWNPNTVTWNNQPPSVLINSGSVSGDNWLRFSATSVVQDWVNSPTTNHGFLLHANGNPFDHYKVWAATETEITGARPVLSVTYEIIGVTYGASASPKRMGANQTMQLPVTLTNVGTETWKKEGLNPHHLSYHWYDQSGNLITWEGLRSNLPADVGDSQIVTVDAKVKAPSTPGTYTLKWDMVKEGAYWFSSKGIATENYTVTATAVDHSLSGLEDFWSYNGYGAAGASARSNAATGNLILSENDISIPGRGEKLSVDRTHNGIGVKLNNQSGYITKWLVNGTYANPNSQTRLSDDYLSGEAGAQPTIGTKSAGNFWRPFASSSNYINLINAFSAQNQTVAYAHTYVYSSTARSAVLSLGSNDGIKAWLNGNSVWTNDADRTAVPDDDTVTVGLSQGWNRLLLKISQGDNAWGFYARLTDTGGSSVTDLKYADHLGAFGTSWQGAFEEHLAAYEENALIYYDADGTAHFVTENYAGSYTNPPGLTFDLTKNINYNPAAPNDPASDGVNWLYKIKETDGSRRYFDGSGRLIRDADGKNTGVDAVGYAAQQDANRTVYIYNDAQANTGGELTKIKDASGRELNITTDSKKITRISDWNSRLLTYAYDPLTAAMTDSTLTLNLAGGKSTHTEYGYDSTFTFSVNKITDPENKKSYFSYDGSGRVLTFRDPRSASSSDTEFLTTLGYGAGVTTVNAPSGKVTELSYNSYANPTRIAKDPAGQNQYVNYVYNEVNVKTNTVDSSGSTTHTVDLKGNVTGEEDKLNVSETAKTSATYDNASAAPANPTAMTDANGNTAASVYDVAGNLKAGGNPIEDGVFIDYDAFKNPTTEASLPKTSSNLAKNGNFELGVAGWPTSVGNTSLDDLSYFGAKSMKVDGTSGQSDRVSDEIAVKASTVYARSAYVKGKGHIITIQRDQSHAYLSGDYDQKFDTKGKWRRVTFSFSSKPNAAYTQVYLRSDYGQITYFDGVQLEEGSVASAFNLLENGSFEYLDGTATTDWTIANGTANTYTGAYKAGSRSYRLHSGNGFNSPAEWWNSGPGNWDWNNTKLVASDFNGDGKDDLGALYGYANNQTKFFVFTSTGSGYNAPVLWWDSGVGNFDWSQAKIVSGDFNADSKSDIAVFYNYGGAQTKIIQYVSNGSGFSDFFYAWDSLPGNWDWNQIKPVSGRFTNDAKSDVAVYYNYGSSRTKAWVFASNSQDKLGAPVLWWDSGVNNWDWNQTKEIAGDYTGDGRADLGAFYNLGSAQTRILVLPSTGFSFDDSEVWYDSGPGNWDWNNTKAFSADVDNDGLTDTGAFYGYASAQTKIWILNSTGSGLNKPEAWWDSGVNNWDFSNIKYAPGDFDGENRDDLSVLYNYGGALSKAWVFLASAPQNITTVRQSVNVKPNTDYVLTGWVTASAKTNTATVTFNLRDSAGAAKSFNPEKAFFSWSRASGLFKTASNAATLTVELQSNSGGAARNVYLDAVQLIENPSVSATEYDSLGNYPLKKTDALGNIAHNTYDGAGNLTEYRDPRSSGPTDTNFRTRYLYNERNLLTQVIDPYDNNTYYAYDDNGNLLSARDALNNTVNYTYNALNQLVGETDPLNKAVTRAYDANGDEATVTQPNGSYSNKYYDQAHRLSRINYNGSLAYSFSYDQAGNLMRTDSTNTANWQKGYDKANRLTDEAEYLAPGQEFHFHYTYDKAGNTTKLEAGKTIGVDSEIYNYTYNANKWLTSASNAHGVSSLFYDDRSNITGIEYAGTGGKIYRDFDLKNRLKAITNYGASDSVINDIAYEYDRADNVATETVDNQSQTYTYDKLNRLDVWYNPAVSKYNKHDYDAVGNITAVKEADSADGPWTNLKTFTYNAGSRITNSGFTYDDNGNLTANGAKTFTYDSENRLKSVTAPNDTLFTDNFSYPSSYWTGVSGTWAGESGEYSASAPSGTWAVNNLKDHTFKDFTYEAKIKPVISGTNYWRAALLFRYQDQNNYYFVHTYENGIVLLKKVNGANTVLGSVAQTIAPNAFHPLKVTTSGTNIKVYYNNESTPRINVNDSTYSQGTIGLAAWGDSYPIHVHFDDAKVTGTRTTLNNYDYQGKRIYKDDGVKKTYYHYSGNNIVAETDQNNNVTARYAYLGGDYKPYSMTRYNELPGYSAITYYFQYNHRGDVLSMTDQWGTVVAKYTYDPWGNILSVKDGSGNDVSTNPTHRGNINPIRYAGYRYDQETGLYYLLARYYDSSTMRFLTKDEDGGDRDEPLTQNPYIYASDNPINNVDPDGDYSVSGGDVLQAIEDYGERNTYAIGVKLRATREARKFASNYKGAKANAVQHAYWSIYLTRKLGKKKAMDEMRAHEKTFFIRNNKRDSAKDMYNNRVGQRLATKKGRIGNLVRQALRQGKLRLK